MRTRNSVSQAPIWSAALMVSVWWTTISKPHLCISFTRNVYNKIRDGSLTLFLWFIHFSHSPFLLFSLISQISRNDSFVWHSHLYLHKISMLFHSTMLHRLKNPKEFQLELLRLGLVWWTLLVIFACVANNNLMLIKCILTPNVLYSEISISNWDQWMLSQKFVDLKFERYSESFFNDYVHFCLVLKKYINKSRRKWMTKRSQPQLYETCSAISKNANHLRDSIIQFS